MNKDDIIANKFGNRLRIRACGLLIKEKKILLIKHEGLGKLNALWAPPGGAVEFGETIRQTIKREFKEETNLNISVEQQIALCEHIEFPLHAIELFYRVAHESGDLHLGTDPELTDNEQIITDIKYLSKTDLLKLDKRLLHPILLNKLIKDLL